MNKDRPKLKRPSHATVVAYLALFVALGGSAYAASQLGKNSVGTKQLKVGAVTQNKIGESAQKALQGASGPRGETGTRGPAGATNVTVRNSLTETVGPSQVVQGTALCGTGEKAVGGGMEWEEAAVNGMVLVESLPFTPGGGPPTGWLAIGANETGATKHFRVRVVCASP